jgi:hypothetical protein
MNTVNHAILEHCVEDFQPLRPLLERFPKAPSIDTYIVSSRWDGWSVKAVCNGPPRPDAAN